MYKSRYKSTKTVLWIILFANIAVAAIKIAVGFSCGSQSVTADGIHSLADGASNIVGLIGIWLASKPRDEKHQYGHEKFEILASLSIGLMLAVMAIRIISRGISSIGSPQTINIDTLQGLMMLSTVIVNSIVAFIEYRCGKKMNSMILVTDSLHTRGDILISCVVLLGLLGIKAGLPIWIDIVMSIAVAVAVLISAGKIIKNCVDVLVDSAVVDTKEIREMLMSVQGVRDVHKIRSRGDASHLFIDLHIIVNPEDDAVHTHGLSHKLEAILQQRFGQSTEINIHLEPDDGRHGE